MSSGPNNNGRITSLFTVATLRNILREHFPLSAIDGANRANLNNALDRLPLDAQLAVITDLQTRRLNQGRSTSVNHQQEMDNGAGVAEDVRETETHSRFMEPPDQNTINERIRAFIDATSNKALKKGTCAVCARRMSARSVTEMDIGEVPNTGHLRANTPHPAHDTFFSGLLLHPTAVDGNRISVCTECLSALKKDKQPRLSLSNNLWIGQTPYQLRGLSLPERIMIARHFPAAYIIKLYPKVKGARNWGKEQLHKGLRGNVSTYKLDPAQLTKVIGGHDDSHLKTYPPPAKILSAMIGVTFVGPKEVSEGTLPTMFRVRRWKVRDALKWLKENNPVYSDIEISEARLDEFPEDGIPEEITLTAKYSNDMEALEREREGYVPEDTDADYGLDTEQQEAAMMEAGLIDFENYEDENNNVEPRTMPTSTFLLQSLGVVDIEGDDISSVELMSHALSNSGMAVAPDDYTIRRGSAFINEYARVDSEGQRTDGGPSNANHLLGSFPTLFPYGEGGFETKRNIDVPYETHVRWSMEYDDMRFRKDYQFPCMVFGVCQKREVCRSSVLQMKTNAYHEHSQIIAGIKQEDLIQASKEETKKIPFSNRAIQILRHHLRAVRTRVKGTDESRNHVRPKIWGTNLVFNPPSLWVTINPADMQDPIAQVLAGIDIDLDKFSELVGPTSSERGANIASDPFASAEFFHLMIKTILEKLFGFSRKTTGKHERKQGILGHVQSYIGTVETQGRGSLHLHMLLWLQDAPTSHEMQELLKTEAFKDRIRHYISAVIKADVDDMTHAQLMALPKQAAVSYSRTKDPTATAPDEFKETEKTLVRALQMHKCSVESCQKVIKGRIVCKRRAPFERALEDWVRETGEWGPKRTAEYVNNFIPALLQALRANHDAKLVLNGRLTAKLTFYIACYATKKQQRSSNTSALIATSMAFKRKKDRRHRDLNKLNKRLIQRCANSLTRSREFSAPEIISYLMGWGDTYESHTYATIYWDSMVGALKRQWPELDERQQTRMIVTSTLGEEAEASRTLKMENGKLKMKDQLKEYQYRSNKIKKMSLLRFLLDTYETDSKVKKDQMDNTTGAVENGEEEGADVEHGEHGYDSGEQDIGNDTDNDEDEGDNSPQPVRRGRREHKRYEYKAEAKKGKKCRVLWTKGHETLPRFIGKWFPRNDSLADRELYCASMLLLLKPWTNLENLKQPGETFEGNFRCMMASADRTTEVFVDNVQYYHECLDSAAEDDQEYSRQEWSTGDDDNLRQTEGDAMGYEDDEAEAGEVVERPITEDDIERALLSIGDPRGQANAEAAMDDAFSAGIFDDEDSAHIPISQQQIATINDMNKILIWEKQLRDTTRVTADERGVVDLSGAGEAQPTTAERTEEVAPGTTWDGHTEREELLSVRPKWAMLNAEQRRAHDIVEDRLLKYMQGDCEQLLMLLLGQGGTGKSTLIGAITETFQYHGQASILAKCATTGIAASDIGGQTLHSWAGISIATKNVDAQKSNPKTAAKRQRNIQGKHFLIIDEASMADKVLTFATSQVILKTLGEEGTGNAELPFGGMNVILSGDFHQFPPVQKPYGALYVDSHPKDSREAIIGRELFLQFETVVILKEQSRTKDQGWMDILDRLQIGQCTEDDIDKLKKLVLTNPQCERPDFSQAPWNDAILVTPRHAVREEWNYYSLVKHCKLRSKVRYIVPAEDEEKGVLDGPCMAARLATASLDEKKTGKLRHRLEIAIGMKAMVLVNLAVEADIANGTRGTVEDIILDNREEEQEVDEEGCVKLKYPPALILFRPDKPTNLLFEGITPGLIPITPSKGTFTAVGLNGKKYRITRRQYAITPGYAFTDYKSQGQTIEYVIIDIGKPGSGGGLSPFSTYVALSRSRGRDTIRLLRDFDEQLFQRHPSEYLEKDMKRIQILDKMTQEKWQGHRPHV
ncbi:hypothetical protein D9619_001956 [Psilocybe cf. subviscida]|uniref:ATP-dependent DNA helicase n=1 Tax=Psilocybe cf. subviscida TaxID=2480587 RepID=A0A8H5BE34_9AGAR|nr:hypothetical protein D9619_001956 [Psilocybe cf. subviscida]